MVNTVVDISEFYQTINDIETLGFDTHLFINAINKIYNSPIFILINDKTEDKVLPSDELNSLRILGTPVYVSVTQIKDNLKSDFFNMVLRIFLNSISKQNREMVVSLLEQLLPQIIASIHYITKEERCMYAIAIEFYLRDSQKFHSPEEFKPKLLENYCDNLTVNCSHRKNTKCFISMERVYNSLNSLESKHILERNKETNGYKYIRW